jgi:hypothetical protein
MKDKRKAPGPLRGVVISHQPPKPTQLPSPWPSPTPPWAKEIADKLDELNKLPANHPPRKRRTKQQPKLKPGREARVTRSAPGTPPLRHQMILAILADVYDGPDGYAGISTAALQNQAAKHWAKECKKRGVDISPPSWDSVNRATGRDRRQP